MGSELKRGHIIAVLAILSIAAAVFLTLHLYRQGTREVLSRYQEQQSLLASHLAAQIEGFFEARSRSLGNLSSLLSTEGRSRRIESVIDYHARQIDRTYVKAVALYDTRGKIVYSTNPSLTAPGDPGSELFSWARRNESRGGFFLRPAAQADSPLVFLLATPVYRQTNRVNTLHETEEFSGVVAFVLDVEKFLTKGLGSRQPKAGFDQIWLIDREGTLHFQPDRPDMVMRSARGKETGCTSCHPSFNYLHEMLARKEGVTEYQVKNEPRKIAGFAPISFGGLSWIVVVTAPADRLTAFVWRSLRDHLALLFIILAMLTTGSYFIIRQERMKTRAEEETRRWQELITVQEGERARISRELHDELGQALTVMKLHVNYIKNRLDEQQVDLRKECEDAVEYTDQVIENVRRLSRDLSPTILEDFGLSAAIRSLATNFGKRHGITVTLDFLDLDSSIPRRSCTLAYRIVQEALTNAAKHARAQTISLTAAEEEGTVCLTIEDDGVGFDMDEAAARGPGEKGLGLATMRAHAEMLGGSLGVCSEAGKGCRITLTLPTAGDQGRGP
jgi:signal transduction histidine kinase/type II secretory pathway pseudopilin PulG